MVTTMRNHPITNEELAKQILFGVAAISGSCAFLWVVGFSIGVFR
jgi:hypothetical protein